MRTNFIVSSYNFQEIIVVFLKSWNNVMRLVLSVSELCSDFGWQFMFGSMSSLAQKPIRSDCGFFLCWSHKPDRITLKLTECEVWMLFTICSPPQQPLQFSVLRFRYGLKNFFIEWIMEIDFSIFCSLLLRLFIIFIKASNKVMAR